MCVWFMQWKFQKPVIKYPNFILFLDLKFQYQIYARVFLTFDSTQFQCLLTFFYSRHLSLVVEQFDGILNWLRFTSKYMPSSEFGSLLMLFRAPEGSTANWLKTATTGVVFWLFSSILVLSWPILRQSVNTEDRKKPLVGNSYISEPQKQWFLLISIG